MKMLFILLLLVSQISTRELQITPATRIFFADAAKGREILLTRDDFIRQVTPIDRALRLKSRAAISEKQFLENIAENILNWEYNEKQQISRLLSGTGPALKKFGRQLPDSIFLIKTTGAEDIGAAYTRLNAIVLPESVLESPRLLKTLIHELFHVLSRHNPGLRDELYAGIGFYACDTTIIPASLDGIRLTNPDAPFSRHYIEVEAEGRNYQVLPVIYSSKSSYDGGTFFDYFTFALLAVKNTDGRCKAVYHEGKVKLFDLKEVKGFFEKAGKNTRYVIHPEEILADNFVLLVKMDQNAPSPSILHMMDKYLSNRLR